MTLSYGVSSGYLKPSACLPGGVCGVGAAGRVPASLTGVFRGVVDYVVGFSRLPFGDCSALLQALWWTSSHRVFPFASLVLELALVWTLWRLRRSVTLVAWCAAPWGTIGCILLYCSCCMDSCSYNCIFLTLDYAFSDTLIVCDVWYIHCIVSCVFCCVYVLICKALWALEKCYIN